MPLFKFRSQLARYITISDASSSTDVILKQRVAEQEYLLPVLGQDLFDVLQTEVDGLGANAEPSELLGKVWTAHAFLAMFKEMPYLHTRITESGLRNVTNDKIQGAYRYQYEDIMDNLENDGLAGLEKLYQFLMDNKGEPAYAGWQESDAYKRLNKNLIRTGAEFSTYYHLYHPHRTFTALQPCMQEAEDLYIIPMLSKEFFAVLKDKQDPDDLETEVLTLLRKSCANFTISQSISKLSIKVRPEGFTIMLGSASDRSQQGENNASLNELERLSRKTERDGNNYLNQAKRLLNEKASVAIFPEYFNSSVYKNPAKSTTDNNDHMTSVYAF